MICRMRSRASQTTLALVLLTCLICPLVETFDSWDHTIQTGNDTEYALVILAVCVGVTYTFARFVFGFPWDKFAAGLLSIFRLSKPLLAGERRSFFVIPIPLSPPVLTLRI
jgi:hypothetical protein